MASDAEYIEQLEQLSIGQEREAVELRAERDRLRENAGFANDAAEAAAKAVGDMAEKLATVMEEREQFRAESDRWFNALDEIAGVVVGELLPDDPTAVELIDLVRRVAAERDRLSDELAVFRDQAMPEAASIMNGLSAEIRDLTAEREQFRAKLHELMARDADAVDLMNAEYGCPDCGVHHACGEIVAERDRLRAALREVYFHLGPPQPPGHEIGEEGVPALVQAAMAERDRLRAAVRRAQATWKRHEDHPHDEDAGDEWIAAWDALDALDVSGEATDG